MRRPRMWSVRLTLAGARHRVREAENALTPALRGFRGRRGGFGGRGLRCVLGGFVGQSGFDLLQNVGLVLGVGIHVARMVPLKMRLDLPIYAPVGVSQVIVDDR